MNIIVDVVKKVCGSDGRSYDSECQLNLNNCRHTTNITILYNGLCGSYTNTHTCDIVCVFSYIALN